MSDINVTVDREMAAPAEKVWAMVSDVTRMGEWSPEASGAKWLGGATGPAVGAKFKGKNQRGWRRWSTTATVVESEPGRAFAFEVSSGPLKVARWSYRLEPSGSGCRVEESWDDQRGAVIRVLGRAATGVADRTEHNREGMAQTLDGLARAAEA